jgi:hypothetical protein
MEIAARKVAASRDVDRLFMVAVRLKIVCN